MLSWLPGAGGLGLVLLAGAALGAGEPKAPPAAPPRAADRGKRDIENPTEQVVAGRSAPFPGGGQPFVNPKVQPGKVRWHADLAEACKAASQSGKPVLLFQMMGRLDEKFC
jgi:hypothetical protein